MILLCTSTVLPGNCGFAAVLHLHLFYHLFSLLHRIVAGQQQAAVKLVVGCLGVCRLSHMGGWGGAVSPVAQQPPSARPDLFAWHCSVFTSCTYNFSESLGLRSKILQKIEELRMKMVSVSVAIPDEFLCPITRELMKEPVIAAGMSLTNIEQNK